MISQKFSTTLLSHHSTLGTLASPSFPLPKHLPISLAMPLDWNILTAFPSFRCDHFQEAFTTLTSIIVYSITWVYFSLWFLAQFQIIYMVNIYV